MGSCFVFRSGSFANVHYVVLRLCPILLYINCGNQLLTVIMSLSPPLLKNGKIKLPVGPERVPVL